jgi:hypothetical protein
MQHRLRFIALVAAFALAPHVAAAQQFNPVPLDSASPRAARAKALAELVMAGDTTKAIEYLREHGAPGYAGTDSARKELLTMMAQVAPNALSIWRYDALGGPLIGLPLASRTGEPAGLALLFAISTDEPHRVSRLGIARMGGDGGG